MRAAGTPPVRVAGRSTNGVLQLHRRLVQPCPAAFRVGLPLAYGLRSCHGGRRRRNVINQVPQHSTKAGQLHPMENVWAYLRANKLCNLVWNSYEAILKACKEAWHFLINDPTRIASIGYREWARVNH